MSDEPSRHPFIWLVYAGLFSAAIPWYFAEGAAEPIWLGLPRWVAVSLAATLAIALFTVFVIERYWDDNPP
ncbi:MAG TPA: hypothetical protein VLK65_21030 [Vicinamibacteria bacterium]|nr:hypothetical protein [Vicinamibacteria bacterium]